MAHPVHHLSCVTSYPNSHSDGEGITVYGFGHKKSFQETKQIARNLFVYVCVLPYNIKQLWLKQEKKKKKKTAFLLSHISLWLTTNVSKLCRTLSL